MSEEKKYWELLEEFEPIKDIRDAKGPEPVVSPTSRRNFLKVLGLGAASATLIASCKRPVEKAIPYFIKPEEITPGIASYYASSYFNQNEFCSVLVKVRDNRPIKLEPNPKSVITPTGTSGRVQASVMDVYNINRYHTPLRNKQSISWEEADSEIINRLREVSSSGQPVLLITSTIISPSTRKLIDEFSSEYGAQWMQYDAIPMDGYREANRRSFGTDELPEYHFENADCIVSIGCDFLGTWLSPVEFSAAYARRRALNSENKVLSRHYHIEGAMSLTGTNADIRIRVERTDYGKVLTYIYNRLATQQGLNPAETASPPPGLEEKLNAAIDDLAANRGRSLVLCGVNNPEYQVLVNGINQMLGNFDNTILFNRTYNHFRGTESAIEALLTQNPGAVILWDVNPVYNHPEAERIKAVIENVPLSVALANSPDETTELCQFILPAPGYLESWDDAEYKKGVVSVMQPTLHKLLNTRQPQETLLAWMGAETTWPDYIRNNWMTDVFRAQTEITSADQFWIDTLRNGELVLNAAPVNVSFNSAETGRALQTLSAETSPGGFTVELTESVHAGTGHGPLNPWLQETPDPVTRIAWGNYASVSPAVARQMQIKNGDVVQLGNLEIPAFVQPGQADNTISVALGYGRTVGIPEDLVTGVNAFRLSSLQVGYRSFTANGVNLQKTGRKEILALVQGHQSMEGRPIVREATFGEWQKNPSAGNEFHEEVKKHVTSLYPETIYPGHKWGMIVDLNTCTGCSACVLACNTENNIPVVGKKRYHVHMKCNGSGLTGTITAMKMTLK
jgi:anaerobic selenocysteine-containing dehydrogenase/ferredoxin